MLLGGRGVWCDPVVASFFEDEDEEEDKDE